MTSLGTIYTQMGLECIANNELTKAESCFEEAERCFDSAKYGEYPNLHAYHSHAHMWRMKGNRIQRYQRK